MQYSDYTKSDTSSNKSDYEPPQTNSSLSCSSETDSYDDPFQSITQIDCDVIDLDNRQIF